MSLKLGPIPDRSPIKLSLLLAPNVHAALNDYAAIHAREYGQEVPVTDLAALMIEKFLHSDAAFKRIRKSLSQNQCAKE